VDAINCKQQCTGYDIPVPLDDSNNCLGYGQLNADADYRVWCCGNILWPSSTMSSSAGHAMKVVQLPRVSFYYLPRLRCPKFERTSILQLPIITSCFEYTSRVFLNQQDRMEPSQDPNGKQHWDSLEDVQRPFMLKWVPLDAECKFDHTIDRSYLLRDSH